MKIACALLLTLSVLLILSACFDEATVHQTLNDIADIEPYTGMVLIPAGDVFIGLSQNQLDIHNQQYNVDTPLNDYTTSRNPDLPPKALTHQKVYVEAFYMDTHEVTWEQYLDFVKASGYESERATQTLKVFPDLVDRDGYFGRMPITQLSVAEMKSYAEWHGKQIPTEIEWEKAARGGLDDTSYPWGNEISPAHANYNHAGILNAFSADNTRVLSSVEGGQYPPNGYGLYDMAGNVSEYVVTDWDDDTYGLDRVITRGGNYRESGKHTQNWYRNYHTTGLYTGSVGFRCIKRL